MFMKKSPWTWRIILSRFNRNHIRIVPIHAQTEHEAPLPKACIRNVAFSSAQSTYTSVRVPYLTVTSARDLGVAPSLVGHDLRVITYGIGLSLLGSTQAATSSLAVVHGQSSKDPARVLRPAKRHHKHGTKHVYEAVSLPWTWRFILTRFNRKRILCDRSLPRADSTKMS